MALLELRRLSGLCHNDLKPDNVVIDGSYIPKLIDFGHSSPVGVNLRRITGTSNYWPPEIAFGHEYDPEKSEVFYIGVYLFILMF